MTSVRGTSFGAAVRRLLGVVPSRSLAEQLKYLTGVRTGATKDSVARQLGVTRGTLQRWISRRQKPSRRSNDKIASLYEKFWRINNKVPAFTGTETLKISSPPDPARPPTRGIRVKQRARDHLIVEQGSVPRNWQALIDASIREINADEGHLFVEAAKVDIPYVEFGPGPYTIEVL